MECCFMSYRKTALMLALCKFLRDKYSLAAVSRISDNFEIFVIMSFCVFLLLGNCRTHFEPLKKKKKQKTKIQLSEAALALCIL